MLRRLADGDFQGQGELSEEPFKIGGVLAGGVDPHVQPGLRIATMQQFELLLQLAIPLGRLHDDHRSGGRLAVGAEKADMVSVACGIDTDAEHLMTGGIGRYHSHAFG